ncbi:16426_t:CDS:1, partial [Funneliformis caledonium]
NSEILIIVLVAFIIGNLGYIETYTTMGRDVGEPILVRVYAPNGKEQRNYLCSI